MALAIGTRLVNKITSQRVKIVQIGEGRIGKKRIPRYRLNDSGNRFLSWQQIKQEYELFRTLADQREPDGQQPQTE